MIPKAINAAAANRGKSAETIVKTILGGFNDHVKGFTFNRVPDAHMAGGRFPAQAGDFQAFVLGHWWEAVSPALNLTTGVQWRVGSPAPDRLAAPRNFIIEVKEMKHDYRLPHKNYSADKVARVQKRVWAGTEAVVVVRSTILNQWRLVPFDVFTTRDGGSWDLRPYDFVNIELALAEFMGLPI